MKTRRQFEHVHVDNEVNGGRRQRGKKHAFLSLHFDREKKASVHSKIETADKKIHKTRFHKAVSKVLRRNCSFLFVV